MIPFSLVLAAIHRADRLRTAVAIVAAATLLEAYLHQLSVARNADRRFEPFN